ncbi:MAG: LysR family transcriptional regulator [Myxococcales bacterium 68-20]|nr:MAG: LysR family transcriptional regulator [Myxococcales bacterium 68-20]
MLDWDDLRFFLALSRHGTMSAAARSLRVAQPTVGRRIAAFEKRLGARLFTRSPTGWALSPTGRRLLAHAERIEHEILAAETVAAGRDEGLEGKIRVTASEWLVRSVLGPALAPFAALNPGLTLDIIADARHLNLARREADLAVRPSRFKQQEVFQRAVAEVEFGLYASDTYLARHGAPDFRSRAEGHVLIGMTDDVNAIVDLDWLPPLVGNARVAVRMNGREPMATVAAAGVGLACLPRVLGDSTPGLRLLTTPGVRPQRTLWLGVHRMARTTPRVRAAATAIATSLDRLRPLLSPSN